jgi:Bacterial TSP3 repeat
MPPRFSRPWVAALACLAPALLTCTNASIYGDTGAGPEAGDRAILQGTACAPVATGSAFPVKVLFVLEGGAPDVSTADTQALASAMTDVADRATVENITFGLVAFHTAGDALLGSFSNAGTFQTAITQFPGYQQSGPVSIAEALELSGDILEADMATSCKGSLARTRYVVVLAYASADSTCSNSIYNGLVDPSGCGGDGGVAPATCVACRLTFDTLALKQLAATYNVGELDVIPVYYTDTGNIDPIAEAGTLAIENAAGNSALEPDVSNLESAVSKQINYGALTAPLVLRRLYAWNRNSIARAGQLLIDSDGDGLSDDDEINIYHTNPLLYDTDGDGIGDGVEVKVGTNPLVPDTLTGCDPTRDDDGDYLNNCEELLLGTDSCQFDTDGDGFSDLVEVLRGTNPLVPENTQDADHDGYANVDELAGHTDPFSVDLAFRSDHAYFTTTTPTTPTSDGRNCYTFTVSNIGLVSSQSIPNPPFSSYPAGENDIYLYLEMGFADRLNGEVSSILVQPITFTAPDIQSPAAGSIQITPDQFVLGN